MQCYVSFRFALWSLSEFIKQGSGNKPQSLGVYPHLFFCCNLLQSPPLFTLLSFKDSHGSHRQIIRRNLPLPWCRSVDLDFLAEWGEKRSEKEHIWKEKWNEGPVLKDYCLFLYSLLKPQTPSKDICPSLCTPKGLINGLANPALNAEPHHTNLITRRRAHRL